MSSLVKAGFLTALRGKKGGYKLTRKPEEYTMKSILQITEGVFAPVSCLDTVPNSCDRAATCKTLKMWEGLQKVVNDYFENITLQDLLQSSAGADDYSI